MKIYKSQKKQMQFKPVLLNLFIGFVFLIFTSFSFNSAITGKPSYTLPDWSQLDPYKDGFEGTRTLEFYSFVETAHNLPKRNEVIVAVIDSGFDINHPALKDNIWQNEKEINGVEGVDDDNNGYIDDYHGWNFLGNVRYLSLEVTRELKRLNYNNTPTNDEYYKKVKYNYEEEKSEIANTLELFESSSSIIENAHKTLKEGGYSTNLEFLTEHVDKMPDKYKSAAMTLITMESFFGINPDYIESSIKEFQIKNKVLFDTTDTHILVGDNPEVLNETGYGNNTLLIDENESHGTHVAGTIAANVPGIGQAPFAKIMCLRAVPNEGDERDKDIGNAIRYAVDNGASVINMSAGKYFSRYPEYVTDAINYANENGVVFVVSAGNEGFNLNENPNYPRKYVVNNGKIETFPNVIVVGASTWMKKWSVEKDPDNLNYGFDLAASFSNYSKDVVDVFAPGVEINSTVPGGKFERLSGTSMASPQVAGIISIIKAFYPNLSPLEIKQLIHSTARQYNDLEVRMRNENNLEYFSNLSISGGVIDVMNIFQELLSN
ncbi:MAG: S8 family serine peptidase [Ignavibacteriaceae bacterium]|nr:MAG: subtilisin-like serine protease [Chlorobi bacterium OLB4]MBV6399365.1 hypothetical protein [Ignavibacteria bacterium]MCC6886810.1 S8 family serine peptidase [Ignavibacteriales bacterium]MEB2329902.1 S8 family serine peptidase [Ignavibacteriaceae bacterium]